jgi:hypothetical protein
MSNGFFVLLLDRKRWTKKPGPFMSEDDTDSASGMMALSCRSLSSDHNSVSTSLETCGVSRTVFLRAHSFVKSPINHTVLDCQYCVEALQLITTLSNSVPQNPRLSLQKNEGWINMGWGLPTWLGGSGSAPQQPAAVREKSKDGGYIAPDRGAREMCYESRDLFFDCLDKHDILDAVKHDEEARRHCGRELGEFERDCARSWVSLCRKINRARIWRR